MAKILSSKKLTLINFMIVFYFFLLWLINYFQVDLFAIGFIVELLTIPFLLGQVIFLILGINFLIKPPRPSLFIISFLLLSICALLTFGSFF
ncbi:hypothetical protein SAMN04487988_1032 [Algoriphagus hitonicola]|uniref:Uncharacterized protein n=1 Tax=Algoriphagus hitonicola TaxID=435880 RepID=A0A1I2R5B0_9BACT|nr:hypothetical protein SAMN04487988_1032 [Algoriphagus hitonicola]